MRKQLLNLSLIALFLAPLLLKGQWVHLGNYGSNAEMTSDGLGYGSLISSQQRDIQIIRTTDDWGTHDTVQSIVGIQNCCFISQIHCFDDSNGILIYVNGSYLNGLALNNGIWTNIIGNLGINAQSSNYIFKTRNKSICGFNPVVPWQNSHIIRRNINQNIASSPYFLNSNSDFIQWVDNDKNQNIYVMYRTWGLRSSNLLVSLDSGVTFSHIMQNSPHLFEVVNFYDSFNGYTIEDNGNFFYSSNGGSLWTLQSSLPRAASRQKKDRIKLKNDSTIFVAGNNGKLYISENHGVSWITDSLPTIHDIYKITLLDSNLVYVTDVNGNLFKNSIVTGIEKKESNKPKVSLFPNPTLNQVNINSERPVGEITVRDLRGRIVKVQSGRTKTIVLPAAKGIYLIEVELTDGNRIFEKVVKR